MLRVTYAETWQKLITETEFGGHTLVDGGTFRVWLAGETTVKR